MSPVAGSSGTKAPPPPELPKLQEPAERQELELPGRQAEPLLTPPVRQSGRLLLIIVILIILILFVILLR